MIDKDKEKQWDQEMAQVDRLLAKLPTYQPGKPIVAGEPTVKHGPGARRSGAHGGTAAGMWLKVGSGLLLAVGVTAWPYSHVCGLNLMFYGAGIGTVLITGLWGAVSSWRRRSGGAHVLSLGVLLWGLVLAAGIVLPRVGYAQQRGIWFCPEPPVQITPNR